MKRGSGMIVALALATLLSTGPTLAVDNSGGVAAGAVAEWYLEQDGTAIGVRIQLVDGVEHARQSGGSVHTKGLNVQVIEATEDPESGEPIFRQLVSEPYFSPGTIEMHALTSASVSATVILSGEEWVGDQDPRPIGPYAVEVAADWVVSGPVVRMASREWDSEWGVKTVRRDALRSATADAEAVLAGDLALGNLGRVEGELVVAHTGDHVLGATQPELLANALLEAVGGSWTADRYIEATASWELSGDLEGGLNLTASQPRGSTDGASAEASIELFAGYCDPATDEVVSVYLTSEWTAIEGWPQRSLNAATVSQTFELWGEESRTPGCAEPAGDVITTQVGPIPLSVNVEWVADGPITHWRVMDSVRAPDHAVRSVLYQRARHALATGQVSGWLDLDLGPSTNAILAYTSNRASVRGEPPGG